MQIKTIDQLPEVVKLKDEDRLIINQSDTSRANLGKVKEYIQGDLPERLDNAANEIKGLETKIEEHNTSEEAHKYIQDLISAEAQVREQSIGAETSARNQAIINETNIRTAADNNLQNDINDTNSSVQNLRYDFDAWIGRGGYLNAFDFGTAEPTHEELTNQALSQIPAITEPLQIWNGTKIVNLFNNHLWVLTNTQDTNPPIFEWTLQGTAELAPFAEDRGGYIIGANVSDPPEYVRPLLNGKGKIDLDAITSVILSQVFLLSHPVNSIYMTVSSDENTVEKMNDKYGGYWEAWGKSRVPVCVDASNNNFNTIEKTGGSDTVTLTDKQIPLHKHPYQRAGWYNQATSGTFTSLTGGFGNGNSLQNTDDNVGGGEAHSNLMRYITCYMYKRIS